ncbi:MAG: dTDP-glucose 4,6-dehydratase [Brevinema sp.]
MNILITGGAGFIGANFVKYMRAQNPSQKLFVLDALTYAGNLKTLADEIADNTITFIKGSINDRALVSDVMTKYNVTCVINFAAESHVDRSIENPQIFLETNILGTQNLLDCAKASWSTGKDDKGYPIYKEGVKFVQVSTDEVYGSLPRDYNEAQTLELSPIFAPLFQNRPVPKTFGKHFFKETTPLSPRSPYSASKASADFIVEAYGETYKLPYNITRCSNNYGPYQFPEKLIPLVIKNIIEGKKLPVYGQGINVRDWLYVEDHCKAIALVAEKGTVGQVYNVGGFNEEQNISIVRLILQIMAELVHENPTYKSLIKHSIPINEDMISYVKDRLGHDARYAIDPTHIVQELGWYPETPFAEGIKKTVRWYLDNQAWVEDVVSGAYADFYNSYYGDR